MIDIFKQSSTGHIFGRVPKFSSRKDAVLDVSDNTGMIKCGKRCNALFESRLGSAILHVDGPNQFDCRSTTVPFACGQPNLALAAFAENANLTIAIE